MAPVNRCLKRTFIIFDVFLGVVGTLWLALVLFSHGALHREEELIQEGSGVAPLAILYLIGIGIVALSAFGLYGALKEKQWALIVFSVGTIMTSLLFLLIAIPLVAMEAMSEEVARLMTEELKNLNEATTDQKTQLEVWQHMFNCCGVHGYQDWGNDIPGTCLCSDPTDNIRCVLANGTSMEVFSEPCFPHITAFTRAVFRGLLAVTFGFAVPVIAVTVMSIIILCQMRRKTITPSVKFRTDPTGSKYSELCETA
ncbi:tetraspanin-8-like [Denticeps clupeoides]|uniref:Tetraspanin n=1 Tax=Denticeps clupeoides TaxID=299321 RepID=A0AAY4BN80_9TELE|nr:tetraspanin-8-like [Denticeps clupeoides]